MSAYGQLQRNKSNIALSSTSWQLKARGSAPAAGRLIIFHLTLATARDISGLTDYLQTVFSDVIEEGQTYPQEDRVTTESFESYFFSGDVFVAVLDKDKATGTENSELDDPIVVNQTLGPSSGWEQSIAGFYYVCNGGFVVPSVQRGKGYASVLARSFLYYAPKLGYKASVFNLVFVNNAASIRLWEKLDFVKAGKIPNAGRLKRKDGQGEEYVDAWVFYKSFETGP